MVVGKVMAAFKGADKWDELSRMDGRRYEIKMSAATSVEIAKRWVSDKLPSDGRLALLRLKMINRMVK